MSWKGRLECMLQPGQRTWDLSQNDQSAIRWALDRIAALQAERDQVRDDLAALAEALLDTFSCDRESEGGHDDLGDCWRCWAAALLGESTAPEDVTG